MAQEQAASPMRFVAFAAPSQVGLVWGRGGNTFFALGLAGFPTQWGPVAFLGWLAVEEAL